MKPLFYLPEKDQPNFHAYFDVVEDNPLVFGSCLLAQAGSVFQLLVDDDDEFISNEINICQQRIAEYLQHLEGKEK